MLVIHDKKYFEEVLAFGKVFEKARVDTELEGFLTEAIDDAVWCKEKGYEQRYYHLKEHMDNFQVQDSLFRWLVHLDTHSENIDEPIIGDSWNMYHCRTWKEKNGIYTSDKLKWVHSRWDTRIPPENAKSDWRIPRTKCSLYKDFAPYSFYFVIEIWNSDKKEYIHWYNGGLIFHGSHDKFGSGSAPTFSVTLDKCNGWRIHT